MALRKGTVPLADTHPELAEQAHGWDPSEYSAGSNKKLPWRCGKGHSWEAAVYARAAGNGCPACAGRVVVPGENDLAARFPDVAAEADGWDPTAVSAHSDRRLPWRCGEGHRWCAVVSERALGKGGCPVCPLPAGAGGRPRYSSGCIGVLAGPPRPPAGVRGPLGSVGLALVLGLFAWWLSQRSGLDLAYADARSHLTIARRLVDGAQPGLVQLGTVWLPLQHLVLAPLVLLPGGWATWAAPVMGIFCLAVSTWCVWTITWRVTSSAPAAWVAAVALCANPGWLYVHTTAFQEPVLFATLLVCCVGLTGWALSPKAYSGGEIAVFCSLPAGLAVLSRYDGWAFAIVGTLAVAAVAQLRWSSWRYSLRCARSFAAIPSVAMAWWLWFNWVNWGDPLEFQRGEFSAQAQQDLLKEAGALPDAGNLVSSVKTFFTAASSGVGWLLLVLGTVGIVVLLRRWRTSPEVLVVATMAVPAAFYVLSLYTGQIALRTGSAADPSMFNLRYGLQVLPALATGLGAAALCAGERLKRPVVGLPATTAALSVALVVALSVPVASLGALGEVPVVAEGTQQRLLADPAWSVASYLSRNATSGDVLLDSGLTAIEPLAGISLDRVVSRSSGPAWERSLKDPTEVEWVVTDTSGGGDAVARAMSALPYFTAQFEPVYAKDTLTVYRRRFS